MTHMMAICVINDHLSIIFDPFINHLRLICQVLYLLFDW